MKNAALIIRKVRIFAPLLFMLCITSGAVLLCACNLVSDILAMKKGDVRIASIESAERVTEGAGRHKRTLLKMRVAYSDGEETVRTAFSQSAAILPQLEGEYRKGNKIHIVISDDGTVFAYANRHKKIAEDAFSLAFWLALCIFFAFLYYGEDGNDGKKRRKRGSRRRTAGDVFGILMYFSFFVAFAVAIISRSAEIPFFAVTAGWFCALSEVILTGEVWSKKDGCPVSIKDDPIYFSFVVLLFLVVGAMLLFGIFAFLYG